MTTTNGVLDLIPFMNTLVTEDAFFNGGDFLQNPVVHVLGKDGSLYRYNQFSLGRSSMIKVADTPIKLGASNLKPYLRPLVDGQKIPVQMLDDILLFFTKVMTMVGTGGKHGEYEAMAHIVWNKTKKEYRVAIPKQKVAKATVTYDWTHVEADEEVILDIHSHNTMGAFFSGTDENDDKTYAGISGVAGELNRVEPKVIWRFNAYKDKVPNLNTEDFFAVPVKQESEAVASWLDLVEVRTYTPPVGGYANNSKVFGAGSRAAVGSNKSLPEDDAWGARFQGSGQAEYTAGVGASRSEALDYLDREFGNANSSILGNVPFDGGWDETVDTLVNGVYNEDDDELNAAVAKGLAESIQDTEMLYQEGIFIVSNASEARKVIERLNKDFNVRSA